MDIERLYAALKGVVGEENILREKEDRMCYSYDASKYVYVPDLVVAPADTAQVSEVMKLADEYNCPVVARGAGTNLVGGTVPCSGGIVLSTHRMNRILDIDEQNLVATVQPGVVTADFHKAVENLGLFFPPDPASYTISTLGGNVAENAGGPHGIKYGVTRDYVLGLEVVLADGRIIRTGGQTMKNTSGYDLTRLFVGSEGTLGIITEITVRLIPKPETTRTMIALFDRLEDAAQAVSNLVGAKIVPACLELIDDATIALIEATRPVGYPLDVEGVLLIEVDGSEIDVQNQIARVDEVCRRSGARQTEVARDSAESERLWTGRRIAFGVMAKKYLTAFPEDTTVPRDRMVDMVRAIKRASAKYRIPIPILGHAGDGNLHPIICTEDRSPETAERAEKAVAELFYAAIDLGGTLSGEHGIGLMKRDFLGSEHRREAIEVMRSIKKLFDPKGLLNPGKIFGEDDEANA